MNGNDAYERWEQGLIDKPECEECAFYGEFEKCMKCSEIERMKNE